MNPGITVSAMILIASFAVDRVATGLLFLLSFLEPWQKAFPEPALFENTAQRLHAEKGQKLVYFTIVGILSLFVISAYSQIRILTALGFPPVSEFIDKAFTVMVLMGGSDRIAELLKVPGASASSRAASAPLQVTGRLILEEGSLRKPEGPAR